MDYKQKYLKYKNKYLNLHNQINIGGFYLADETVQADVRKKKILSIVKKHMEKYSDIFGSANYSKLNLTNINIYSPIFWKKTEEYKKKIDTPEYIQIYEELVNIYKKDVSYEQIFRKQTGEIISQHTVYPYHINFAALIFTSFLVEYELFNIIYTINKYNSTSQQQNNTIEAIFEDFSAEAIKKGTCSKKDPLCTSTRIYKDTVNKDYNTLITEFSKILDDIFYKFMNSFVKIISDNNIEAVKIYPDKYNAVSEEDIYNNIVPHEHFKHIDKTFDYIFINWKEKITNITKFNRQQIDRMLKYQLNVFEDDYSSYIAEGTGFFSFIYLNFPDIKNTNFFGSCITMSMLELYFMSRLHIHPRNMFLRLETKTPKVPHLFWKNTQDLTNIPSITHWSTYYSLSEPIELRHVFSDYEELNFLKSPENMFRALIYPIYDSNLIYINGDVGKKGVDSLYGSTTHHGFPSVTRSKLKLINDLIQNRITMFENLLKKTYVMTQTLPKLSVKSEPEP